MGFVKTMDEITENFLGTFEFYDAELPTFDLTLSHTRPLRTFRTKHTNRV